ncbi:hypothetical protein BWI97_07325 [Siphonobacter sp. BAB-5405]|uniref:helix-turn-helix transcriptional regulator n=1 Tax=Siphonobacter sp. BAB-5405 TaxID=1864825 RepID=UPI000C8024EF|nr:helix-turn-helix transcriptional regulator [Siphonobacter sp. BAB-5405]PMD97434.1 hypothetical protein BWI97_07325 [Siphonobacter sp. BAB-5405]
MYAFPDPQAARSRWKTLADQLNEQQPTEEIIQTFKDGRTRKRVLHSKQVSTSVRKTGRDLISLYIGHLHQTHRKLGDKGFEGGEPGFLTNRVELANLWGCSERTAYTHLVKLQEAGLVSKRKFRGTRADFEVYLSTEILFGRKDGESRVKKPVFQMPASSLPTLILQNLPLNNASINQGNNKTETIKGCGFGDNTATNQGNTQQGNKNQGNTERQQPPLKAETGTQYQGVTVTMGAGGAAAGSVDNSRPAKGQRTPAQRQAIFEGYLTSFWVYAKQLLYSGRSFTKIEENQALQEIAQGVYRNFKVDFTEKEWDEYQTELFKRLELAAGYYQRHADRYPPDPYSKFKPGSGYFCQENQRGFRNTDNWLAANRTAYRTAYVTQRLSLAIRHLQQHLHGRAPKRLQAKTYLEAFRYLEEQMKRYGQNIHEKFLTAASAVSQAPAKTEGFTKRIQTKK